MPGAGERANGEVVFNEDRISVWDREGILETDGSDSQRCECI